MLDLSAGQAQFKKLASRISRREGSWHLEHVERCSLLGYPSHLMRPEVASYVIRATQELADILGISLAEVR